PNEYTVYLAPDDREQFSTYEPSLVGELQDYLAENARRENYALLTPPRVLITSDDDLGMGEFGIATRMVQPDGRRAAPEEPPVPETPVAQTMIYRPKPDPTEAASAEELGVEREVVALTANGVRHEIGQRRTSLGR